MAEHIVNDNELALAGELAIFKNNRPTVLGYSRVSTDEQRDHGHSLKTQPELVRKACDAKFGPGQYNLYLVADEGISGRYGTYRPGVKRGRWRPGLTLAAQMAERGLIQYVAASRCDRISRKQRIWLEFYEDYLECNSIGFFSATEAIDCDNTPSGKFLRNVIFLLAEVDRDKIIEVTTHGMSARRREGYTVGSPPYGWRLQDRRALPKGLRPGIVQVPEEADVVRRIAEWYLAGKTRYWMAQELNRQGVRTKTGKLWNEMSIKSVLLNHVHAGFVKDENGNEVPGAHAESRIIEESTYWAIKERWKTQSRVTSSTKTSTNHIFGELTQCAVCGQRMYLSTNPGEHSRYTCLGRNPEHPHPSYSARVDLVETGIVDCLRRIAARREFLDLANEEVSRLVDEEGSSLKMREKNLLSELEAKNSEILNWCRLFNDGQTDRTTYERYKSKLEEDEAELSTQLADVQEQMKHRKAREDILVRGAQMLSRFSQVWDSLELSEKRAFASYVIDGPITFRPLPNRVEVTLKPIPSDEAQSFIVYRRGRGGRGSVGLESLSLSELTTAYYFLQGLDENGISKARDISIDAIRGYRASLIKRAEAGSLEEALQRVAPMVAERESELLIGKRWNSRHFRREFTEMHKQILELKARGLTNREVAKKLGTSPESIASVIRRIFWKLDVNSMKDAVAAAREIHIIPGPTIWSEKPTQKQMDVLVLLDRGLSQPEIAKALGIKLCAVKERVRCMFDKFGPRTVNELLKLAGEKGWIG